MNAERLLALFDRVADRPNAMPRLRRLVLDLAVRGELVEQDPGDKPAAELLALARRNLEAMAAAATRLRWKPTEPVSDQEINKPLPAGWIPARVNDAALYVNGLAFKPTDWKSEGVPIIRIQNLTDRTREFNYAVGDFPDEVTVRDGDLLVSWSATIEAFKWDRGDGVLNQHIFRVIPDCGLTDREYLLLMLRSAVRELADSDHAHGLVMTHINRGPFLNHVVLIPPLAEQRRIVARVEELMGLLERLETAHREREAMRNTLTAAHFARLTDATATMELPSHARFLTSEMPALTASVGQIQALRQSLLNLAVRGKLVKQDPSDESVEETLDRVGRLPRPQRFAKRNQELILGDCGLSVNMPGGTLPAGWLWVPLVDVARIESGHTPSRNRPEWWDGDVPWVGLVDARAHNNGRIYETIQHTNSDGIANSAARLLPEGTVCISRTASVGYVVILGRPMATSQDFVNWVPGDAVSSRWLQLVMIAERSALARFSKGAVHQTIYYPAWLAMHIALPPQREQHRIVAAVDALMALCDRLEAALRTADTVQQRLLDALISEVLQHCGPRELVA